MKCDERRPGLIGTFISNDSYTRRVVCNGTDEGVSQYPKYPYDEEFEFGVLGLAHERYSSTRQIDSLRLFEPLSSCPRLEGFAKAFDLVFDIYFDPRFEKNEQSF